MDISCSMPEPGIYDVVQLVLLRLDGYIKVQVCKSRTSEVSACIHMPFIDMRSATVDCCLVGTSDLEQLEQPRLILLHALFSHLLSRLFFSQLNSGLLRLTLFYPIRRKLVIIGDGACGKTSLLSVFTLGYFPTVSGKQRTQRPGFVDYADNS